MRLRSHGVRREWLTLRISVRGSWRDSVAYCGHTSTCEQWCEETNIGEFLNRYKVRDKVQSSLEEDYTKESRASQERWL